MKKQYETLHVSIITDIHLPDVETWNLWIKNGLVPIKTLIASLNTAALTSFTSLEIVISTGSKPTSDYHGGALIVQ